jgi:hypothetical protein
LMDAQIFVKEYEAVRKDVDCFMAGGPPAFPNVQPILESEDRRKILQALHTHAVQWFKKPFGAKPGGSSIYTADKLHHLEENARVTLLRAESKFRKRKPHPLRFLRVIHKTPQKIDLRGGTLIYHSATNCYAIALEIYGRYADIEHKRTFLGSGWCLLTDRNASLEPHKALACFGLEFGDYQHRIFKDIQSQTRDVTTEDQVDAEQEPSPQLKSLKLVTELNRHDAYDFYAHIGVLLPTPPILHRPQSFVAFHHHTHGYSFACMSLDGEILKFGDLVIPPHVQPKRGGFYSHNFKYEVAHAMLDLALEYQCNNALTLVGIEDTVYLKQNPSASRTRNRVVFGYPTKQVITALIEKAAERGFMRPLVLGNVSPSHDCPKCGIRDFDDSGSVRLRAVTQCFVCRTRLRVAEKKLTVTCSGCGTTWSTKERTFTCRFCGHRTLGRYNTALTLVHDMPRQLVEVWKWHRKTYR